MAAIEEGIHRWTLQLCGAKHSAIANTESTSTTASLLPPVTFDSSNSSYGSKSWPPVAACNSIPWAVASFICCFHCGKACILFGDGISWREDGEGGGVRPLVGAPQLGVVGGGAGFGAAVASEGTRVAVSGFGLHLRVRQRRRRLHHRPLITLAWSSPHYFVHRFVVCQLLYMLLKVLFVHLILKWDESNVYGDLLSIYI